MILCMGTFEKERPFFRTVVDPTTPNPHSAPVKPTEFIILQILTNRMELSDRELYKMEILRRGYEGERLFSVLLKKELRSKCIILYDLLLEWNGTEFQIDCLLIFQQTIYLLEIKNMVGDFIVEKKKWYAVKSNKEIRNPLHQLERTEILFKQFLQANDLPLPIKSFVLFVGDHFTLYQAPLVQSIVFPTQLQRFVHSLNEIPDHMSAYNSNISNVLTKKHLSKSSLEKYPNYEFKQLRKGITCPSCNSFLLKKDSKNLHCNECGLIVSNHSALSRAVNEFQTLFLNEKIMTPTLHDWCGGMFSERMIRRNLGMLFNVVNKGRSTYFEV